MAREPEVRDDDSFLDEAFDRALSAIEQGRALSVDDLAAGREDLRPRLLDVLRLAQVLAVHRAPLLPRLPTPYPGK